MENHIEFPDAVRSPFSKEEKVALLLLVVAGIGGVIFGVKYLGKNLVSPFQLVLDESYTFESDKESAELAAMKERDTDADTLSDYDEQYVYQTSPYLDDSDSDGFGDAVEISSGNDPNCPVDRTCGSTATGEEAVDLGEQVAGALDAPEGDFGAFEEQLSRVEEDPMAVLSELTPDQLRELLKGNGVDEATLAGLEDDELLAIYQEALAQFAEQQQATTGN